jgi:hypothetical protein
MNTYRLKGASGKVAGQTQALGQVTCLGSDVGCDLVIEDENVSARQAEIRLEADGSLRLLQLDANFQTLLNGKPVTDSLLKSGDEIRLGTCRWVLQAPGLRPEKVLTEDAVKRGLNWLPWLLVGGVVAIALAAAWQQGWLSF